MAKRHGKIDTAGVRWGFIICQVPAVKVPKETYCLVEEFTYILWKTTVSWISSRPCKCVQNLNHLFLPNLPSSILWWQHHHSSLCASLCPSSRQKESRAGSLPQTRLCSVLSVTTSVRVLTLSCARLLQLGSKLVFLRLDNNPKYLPYHRQQLFF